MQSIPKVLVGSFFLVPMLVGGAVSAVPASFWSVEGKLYGKPKDGGQEATDISGLACAPVVGTTRTCLIVDDESQGAQLVLLREGHLVAGDTIRLSRDMLGNKPLELDAEGVAFADGVFYVVGSHGRPRHDEDKSEDEIKARTQATRHLYRIDLSKAGVDPKTGKFAKAAIVVESVSLDRFIAADPRLAAADVPLDENGLTIEGLAVSGHTLCLGFRGPSVSSTAVALDIPLSALFDGQPGKGVAQLLTLGLDTSKKARGIRDLSRVAGGYVGIAGPVTDPADKSYVILRGDYALFWWDGHAAPVLRDLDGFGIATKPEAIVPLSLARGKLRALLLFDGPLRGKPTVVEIDFSAG